MKVSVENVYTSVACNRMPEIVDWNNDGLICFGASNAVVVYDTKVKGKDPLTVLTHHTSRVNSVKWLRKQDETCIEIVSCSADKTAAIWSLNNGEWKVTSKLTGHTDGVTCVFGIYTGGDNLNVYTTSIDSTVKVWERCNGETQLKQTISLNSGLCLTLHAHLLPIVNKPVLFCALDDHKIHMFAGDEYYRVHTLLGHEDWVRGLDVLDVDETTIMLASASQDTYIRLWRIQQHSPLQPSSEIRVEEKVFHAYELEWSVKLDAVLAGHEGWVYGVQWHPYVYNEEKGSKQPVYRLLSSSLDKTVIVWEPEGGACGAGGGAWAERVRVGEVGGSGLGFYGSRFGPRGDSFMGHGYNGSFHIWTLCKESGQWEPAVVCGGHFAPVEDVRWEPRRGRYLVSVSADQTNRVHAPWRRNGCEEEWHEIARPQVHGYDLSSVALVDSVTFASAAEEKVVRVFRAPHNFLHNFRNIVGEELVDDPGVAAPEGASVPSLGLSNKAVFAGDAPADDNDGYFVPVTLTEPPTEETLMQNTLWPEVQKLYGHGYEVYTLDASPDGTLLASACKATTAEHAAVLLWETTNWQQIQKLVSHQLTVTQLAFSPDSQQLVSVSRDRRWTLYRRQQGSNSFELAAATDKTNGVHTRIIWCCAWAHDSSVFATGSREGKVCVWYETEERKQSSLQHHALSGSPLELAGASVTALAFAPVSALAGRRVVAVGLDSGIVRIYAFDDTWELLHEMTHDASHHLTVKRLSFSPRVLTQATEGRGEGDGAGGRGALLASAGADHLVRIHAITIS